MTLLARAHEVWAWIVVVLTGAAGAWALAADRVERARHRALWWFTAVAHGAVGLQVTFGVALIATEEREAPQFHVFYGFLTLVAVFILYAYRQQMRHRIHQLYGFGGLFLMGLAIRALILHR